MSWLSKFKASELGGLTGDSLYTAVWLGAVSVADLVQIALVTHALGLSEYGRLALVMSFVVLVAQFFDVRVGTAETTYGAARISREDWVGVAGVFRFGYGVDALTGLLGFAVVAIAAPAVGPWLIGDGGSVLIVLYAVTLLASTVDDSSATLVRLLGRFRLLTTTMTAVEVLRVATVAIALSVDPSLVSVLLALVVYDLVGAVANILLASRAFEQSAHFSLLKRPAVRFPERRAMMRTVLHTNLVSYARIAQVQLPTLLLGALTTTTQVGLYKVGTATGSIVGRIVDPIYATTLPRLARLWALRRRIEIERLIRHATPVTASVTGATLLVLVVFSDPILKLLGGSEAVDAKQILVLVGVGYAVGATLFWNTSLLFAAGRSGAVSLIAMLSAAFQITLLVPLAVAFEATGAALALAVALVASNLVAGALAWRTLRDSGEETQSDSIRPDQALTARSFE